MGRGEKQRMAQNVLRFARHIAHNRTKNVQINQYSGYFFNSSQCGGTLIKRYHIRSEVGIPLFMKHMYAKYMYCTVLNNACRTDVPVWYLNEHEGINYADQLAQLEQWK